MLIKNIILLILLKFIKVKANSNSLCVISSDYVPNILSNLVYEYKFTELNSTKDVLSQMKDFIDEMRQLWHEAIDYESNYDSYMFNFFYITEEYKRMTNQAISKIDLISVRSDDIRLKTVVDFIKREDYQNAVSAYKTLGNEGLLFTIVQLVYTADPRYHIEYDITYTLSITKLIKFSTVLLESKMIKSITTLSLALCREMINSKNIFTFDMMYFAEFVVKISKLLNTEYFHIADYEMLREQLIYIEKSLPGIIQNAVFGYNNYNQTEYFYIRNEHWKEHIFVDEFFHDNCKDRRIAYSWETGIMDSKKKWKIQFDMKRVGYVITSHDYDEYLYATDKDNLYNVTIRPIFTRKELDLIEKGIWLIEPMENNKYFLIRNKFYDEYIYVPEDEIFVGVHSKRRVFSYLFEAEYFVPFHAPGIWTFERV